MNLLAAKRSYFDHQILRGHSSRNPLPRAQFVPAYVILDSIQIDNPIDSSSPLVWPWMEDEAVGTGRDLSLHYCLLTEQRHRQSSGG